MTGPLFEVTMTVDVRDPDRAAKLGQHDHVEVTVRGRDLEEALASAQRSIVPLAQRLTSRAVQ